MPKNKVVKLIISPKNHLHYIFDDIAHSLAFTDSFLKQGYYIKRSYKRKNWLFKIKFHVEMIPGNGFWENKLAEAIKNEQYEAVNTIQKKLDEARTIKF